METKKNQRKLRYLVAVVGYVLVALELMLAFNEVALYQSLICSVYLLFNILVDVYAWFDEYRIRRRREVRFITGRLIALVVLVPFWGLFSWLLGLIAPKISRDTIMLCSVAVVLVLGITAMVPSYIVKERSFPKKKRSAFRTAIGTMLVIVVPYIVTVVILSAFGILPRYILSPAIFAFLPIMLFAMTLSSMIASRSLLKDALGAATFFASIAAIPFLVDVLLALQVSYQIPYVCVLAVVYGSLIHWLRRVRAKNRQERERRTSQGMNQ